MTVRIIAFAVGLLLLPVPRADSCDCLTLPPLSDAVRTEAPVIFEGKVVEIAERALHTQRATSGGGSGEVRPLGKEAVFGVSRVWSGVTQKRATVSIDQGDCSFPFEVDRTYVVFARKDAKGRLTTSICMRTAEADKAGEIVKRLGPGK
jgi:hypothetical protein